MAKKISINSKRQDEIAENVMNATLDLCKTSRLPGYKLLNALAAVMSYVIYETATEKVDEVFNDEINRIGILLHIGVETLKQSDEEDEL